MLFSAKVAVFYSPDLVYIHDRGDALFGVRLYIGDGATLKQSFLRRRGDRLIGHAPVQTQWTWCQKEGVPEAVITPCGSQIVEGDERRLGAEVSRMGRLRCVAARIAFDGMEAVLR